MRTLKTMIPALIVMLSMLSMAKAQENFSGIYTLDANKTQHIDAPLEIIASKLKISQTNTTIIIQRTTGERVITDTLSLDGMQKTSITPTGRTKVAGITWSADKKQLIEVAKNSTREDANTPDYTIKETWSLSVDGKTLTIVQFWDWESRPDYTFSLVYNKQ